MILPPQCSTTFTQLLRRPRKDLLVLFWSCRRWKNYHFVLYLMCTLYFGFWACRCLVLAFWGVRMSLKLWILHWSLFASPCWHRQSLITGPKLERDIFMFDSRMSGGLMIPSIFVSHFFSELLAPSTRGGNKVKMGSTSSGLLCEYWHYLCSSAQHDPQSCWRFVCTPSCSCLHHRCIPWAFHHSLQTFLPLTNDLQVCLGDCGSLGPLHYPCLCYWQASQFPCSSHI